MTHNTQTTAHAEITAPISADLRRLPALSEQDAGLLEQAASMLEALHDDEHRRGNSSAAVAAACSSDAVRRLAAQLLQAAPPAPAAVAVQPAALESSILDLEAWEDRSDGEPMTLSEAESVSLVLQELKRLRALAAAPAQPDLRKHLRWALHLLRNDEGGCCGQRHSEAVHALERADAVAAWSQESAAPAQAVAVPITTPRFAAWTKLRDTGFWPDGVPDWARDATGRMHDMTAAKAVISELHEAVRSLATAPAQEHATQLACPVQWRSIETAPNDGTLLRLLVEFETGNLEDDDKPQATIGHNSFANTGVDEWQFSGWSWTHDCFVQGTGRVVGWLPLLDDAAPAQAQGCTRSHPHENMSPMCVLRTEIARLNHAAAIGQVPAAPVAHPHHCTARSADGACEECEGHAQAMAEWRAEAAAPAQAQEDARDEWEGIDTLPNCDDLIWLYCQDTNTTDGPVIPSPSYADSWTHWAFAEAPSTRAIDAARAAQGGAA